MVSVWGWAGGGHKGLRGWIRELKGRLGSLAKAWLLL